MSYMVDKDSLIDRIAAWDGFLKRRIRLIACGGTALTLLGVKASTKDIDLMVPDIDEYKYLLGVLKQLGYKPASGWGWARGDGFIFDIFKGKAVHTTELLESPLEKGNNIPVREFEKIYLGILNYYDILISKLFRASAVDIDDCLLLVRKRNKDINIKRLKTRFKETASYDVSENRVNKNFNHFLRSLKKEGLFKNEE